MINLEWTLLQEEAQWKACNAMFVRSFFLYYLLIAISSVWLKKERKWLQNLSSLAITLPLHKNVLSNGSALLLERDLSLDNKQDRFHYSLQLLYKKSFMKFNSMLRDKMKEEHQIIKKLENSVKKASRGKRFWTDETLSHLTDHSLSSPFTNKTTSFFCSSYEDLKKIS